MASAYRESFSANYDGSPGADCPPSKVRRTSASCIDGKQKENRRCATSSQYFTCTNLGFCVNEFLPMVQNQEEQKVAKRPSSFNINLLSDDILGKCFFNGYLDTFETMKLTVLNKRTRCVGLTQIQLLDLRKCKNLTADQVAIISSLYQNLQSLDLSYCPQFGRNHLIQLVDSSKNLRHLVLRGTAVDDNALVEYIQQVDEKYGECQIETLDLSAVSKETCRNIGDRAAEAISKYCPKLKCLKLGWCKNLTDEGIRAISKLRRLTELDVSLTGITVNSCHILLETLGPNLEVLDLSATAIFQLFDFKDTSGWITFSNMQKLSTLKLQFCEELSAASLEHIVQNAVSLKSIDVRHSGIEGTILISKEQGRKFLDRNIQITGATITN